MKKYDMYLTVILCASAVLLLADVGTWAFEGRQGLAMSIIVRVCNFLVYLMQYVLLLGVGEGILILLHQSDGEKRYALKIALDVIMLIEFVLLILNCFFPVFYSIDANNIYHRGPLMIVATISSSAIMIGIFAVALYSNTRHRIINPYITGICMVIVGTAVVLQYVNIEYAVLDIALTICIAVLTVAQSASRNIALNEQEKKLTAQALELAQRQAEISERDRELSRQKELLTKAQLTLMRSQIKPHFLFNSLTVIRGLISENSEDAVQAVDSFSKFLRRSIRMIDSDELIPFETELDLVNSYYFLEQHRFPGMVELHMNLDERFFMLPALSVQPLVENAINHGIREGVGKGVVTLETYWEDGDYVITVSDDGMGFDIEATRERFEQGTALRNIERRLAMLCGGKLEISSSCDADNHGTTVTMRIPSNLEETIEEMGL